jgi:hypothetical protein
MGTEGSFPRSQQPAVCPRPICKIRNILKFLRWGVVSTSPNLQAGGPPLVDCLRLLIEYIGSYPPYLEAVPPSAAWGRDMPWWHGPTCHGAMTCWQGPTCHGATTWWRTHLSRCHDVVTGTHLSRCHDVVTGTHLSRCHDVVTGTHLSRCHDVVTGTHLSRCHDVVTETHLSRCHDVVTGTHLSRPSQLMPL